MIPHERSLVKKLENEPFALIGVNSDTREAYDAEVESMGVTWRSFMVGPRNPQNEAEIPRRWNVRGWPTVYIIDADGVIRYKNVTQAEPMEEAVTKLLAEMKTGS